MEILTKGALSRTLCGSFEPKKETLWHDFKGGDLRKEKHNFQKGKQNGP